jgi:hypothetical protein
MRKNSLTTPPWRCVIISLVCGLTLAASGDDVCLLRIVPPSLPDQAVSLDDPNADFTASSDSSEILTPALLHQPADDLSAVHPPALSPASSSLRETFDADLPRPSLSCALGSVSPLLVLSPPFQAVSAYFSWAMASRRRSKPSLLISPGRWVSASGA